MKILLVDDHVLYREGLRNLLSGQPDMCVVGTAETVSEAIEKARNLEPDIILMNFVLPDGTGLEATQAILAEQPDMNIVFLTVHVEDERLFEAIRLGASGYLVKKLTLSIFLMHLRGVMDGDAALKPPMTRRIMKKSAQM